MAWKLNFARLQFSIDAIDLLNNLETHVNRYDARNVWKIQNLPAAQFISAAVQIGSISLWLDYDNDDCVLALILPFFPSFLFSFFIAHKHFVQNANKRKNFGFTTEKLRTDIDLIRSSW